MIWLNLIVVMLIVVWFRMILMRMAMILVMKAIEMMMMMVMTKLMIVNCNIHHSNHTLLKQITRSQQFSNLSLIHHPPIII